MFAFTFGAIGSGKSLSQAQKVQQSLKRSIAIEKKWHLPIRKVGCNFHIRKDIADKYADRFFVWHDPLDMIFEDYPKNKVIRRDFDCFWDELAVELASDKWKDTHPEIRRFFAQHRKRGIEIYGNTQDYMMLDINARRMATDVFMTQKIIGSRDPSSTLPPLKHIWGLIAVWDIDKQSIEQDSKDFKRENWLPQFLWLDKDLTSFYDTSEDVSKASEYDLLHRVRKCKICGFEKTIHE